MMRVLLVEDDNIIAKIISYYLMESGGYEVLQASTAGEALSLVRKKVDVILMDIMLPDVDGIALCTKLRETVFCPIIFISCIDDERTIVRALEMGGDDYLTKPFSCDVLKARIEANLRRVRRTDREEQKTPMVYQDFTINLEQQTVWGKCGQIHLSPTEYALLLYLALHPGRTISPGELYEQVWGTQSFGDARTVVVHMHHLRRKLEPDAGEPKYIVSIRKKGYCFLAKCE